MHFAAPWTLPPQAHAQFPTPPYIPPYKICGFLFLWGPLKGLD